MKKNLLVHVESLKTIKNGELRPNYSSIDAKVLLQELDKVRKVYNRRGMKVYFNYTILEK